MFTAVDDVHHRHRQHMRRNAADVRIQRQAARISSRFGHGQRHAKDGVGAKAALVLSAIQLDHRGIDVALIFGIKPDQRLVDFVVDGFNRLQHALALITALVAIA